MINCEPDHIAVEGLGGIDIRYGNTDHLQSVIHQLPFLPYWDFEVCVRRAQRLLASGTTIHITR